jgi:4-amino-4-deoxy-L-arabinose transferase-like glycosyltransferase
MTQAQDRFSEQAIDFQESQSDRVGCVFCAALLVLGVVAIGVVIASTRWGPAVGDDSYRYITAARNLTAGLGFGTQDASGSIVPQTHFPPFVSLSLAPFEIFGVDDIQAFRWINAIAFGSTVALSGLAVYWMTKSHAFSLFGALLILLSEVMIVSTAAAMSEALYLLLALSALMLLSRSGTPRNRRRLLSSAALVGLAFLTRYVGVALVAAGFIWLLLDFQVLRRRRWFDAGLFVAGSTLPITIWVARNWILFNNATDRSAMLHPLDLDFLRRMLNVVFIWFAPGRLVHGREPLILLALLALTLIIAGFSLRRRLRSRSELIEWLETRLPSLEALLLTYAVTYIAVFLVSRFVYDPAIYPDNRLLAPLHHVLLVLLPVLLARLWSGGQQIIRGLVLALGAMLVFLYANRAVNIVTYMIEEGFGYTSRQWHGSEAIAMVKSMEDRDIYTNAIPAIYFWTGRTVRPLHRLQDTKARLESDCAAIVVFDSIPFSLFGVTREEVSENLRHIDRDIADLYFHPACEDEIVADLIP